MSDYIDKQRNDIDAVKWWLEKTVINHNFCPFARKEFVNESIHYCVVEHFETDRQLECLVDELKRLDRDVTITTSLVLYPNGLENFFDYLDFVDLANQLLEDLGYQGVYQIASFHPDYCFEGCIQSDPSNYTNRSPLPILHLLREDMLEKVLSHYPSPEKIPEENIALAKDLGESEFIQVLAKAALIRKS